MNAKIIAVLMIFFILTAGGVVLMALQEREVGNMMITAGISFIMGVGVMIISGNEERKKRESMPPPFNPRKRMGTPPHYKDKPFDRNGDR